MNASSLFVIWCRTLIERIVAIQPKHSDENADAMNGTRISVCSVSWIDEKPLPNVGFWLVAGAAISWPKRVIMGLVGTSNPQPPLKLQSVDTFRSTKQYRALLSCSV